jgi:hypothetical protein
MMQSLKVDHLKEVLARLRLNRTGLKAELQARLLAALTAPASRAMAERAIGDVYSLAHGLPPTALLSPYGGGGADGAAGGSGGGGKMASPLGGAEAYRAATTVRRVSCTAVGRVCGCERRCVFSRARRGAASRARRGRVGAHACGARVWRPGAHAAPDAAWARVCVCSRHAGCGGDASAPGFRAAGGAHLGSARAAGGARRGPFLGAGARGARLPSAAVPLAAIARPLKFSRSHAPACSCRCHAGARRRLLRASSQPAARGARHQAAQLGWPAAHAHAGAPLSHTHARAPHSLQ